MMRSLFLCLVCACSTPDPSNTDAGEDASTDATTDAPAETTTDGSSCNVTAAATVTGTFGGQSLAAQDALAFESHTTQYEVVVGITDYMGACGLGNDVKANSNVVAIIYQAATPLVPATIDIAQTNTITVIHTPYNATCQGQGTLATTGTITFTRVDDCAVTGSFDLVFASDHVTGTFEAPVCAAAPDGGSSNCKP